MYFDFVCKVRYSGQVLYFMLYAEFHPEHDGAIISQSDDY